MYVGEGVWVGVWGEWGVHVCVGVGMGVWMCGWDVCVCVCVGMGVWICGWDVCVCMHLLGLGDELVCSNQICL